MKSIGMDVHAAQTVFCVVAASGEVLARGKVPTTAAALQSVIREHARDDDVQVALEAATPAFWVRDVLVQAGARVEVTNPYKVRLIAESRAKTDASDAWILAELLRCGGLPRAVYVPPTEIRELREQLALRRQLVRMRTQIICAAKASLRRRGLKYDKRAFHGAASWEEEQAQSPAASAFAGVYHQIEQQRENIEEQMAEHWGKTLVFKRLRSIPGVGPMVASTLVAAIGEVERFSSAAQLSSYAGMVPTERSSGTSVVRGGITHQGRSEVCSAMVQAAWAVLRTKRDGTEGLKKFFYKIMFKRGSQVAAVALARKLLTIVYHVWKDETMFDGTKVGSVAAQDGRCDRPRKKLLVADELHLTPVHD